MKILYEDSYLNKPQAGIGVDSTSILTSLSELGHSKTSISRTQILSTLLKPIGWGGNDALWLTQISPFKARNFLSFVRLHDLFPITHPDWFTVKGRAYFRLGLKNALENDSVFVCNSQTTANNLRELTRVPESRVAIVTCAVPDLLANSSCGICDGCKYVSFDIKNMFIALGTIEPRKNYELLIEVSDRVKNARFCIIGKPGWKSKHIQYQLEEMHNLNKITWLKWVCDAKLQQLINQSKGLLSTSFDEGFGIPAAIARDSQVPIIVKPTPINLELHHDYPMAYFANDVPSFSEHIDYLSSTHRVADTNLNKYRSFLKSKQLDELRGLLSSKA